MKASVVVMVVTSAVAISAAAQPLSTSGYRHEMIRLGAVAVPALVDSRTSLVSLLEKPSEHHIRIPLGPGALSGNLYEVEAAARAFLNKHPDVVGIPLQQIGEARVVEHDDGWSVTFIQRVRGVAVRGSQIGLTMNRKGRLLSFGVDAVPGISVSTAPSISERYAEELALAHFGPNTTLRREPRLLLAELTTGSEQRLHLVWEVRVFSEGERLGVDIDAHTGEILRKYFTTRRLSRADEGMKGHTSSTSILSGGYTAAGHVYFEHWTRNNTSIGSEGNYPFAQSRVRLLDPSGVAVDSTLTDATGYYSISYPSTGYQLEFVRSTPYAIDRSGGTSPPYPVQPYQHQDHSWTAATNDPSWRSNAVAHMTEMRDWFKNEAGLATNMQAGLEIPDDPSWFAGSDGETLLLVPNAAKAEDAISHEYTHAFIFRLYGGRLIEVNDDSMHTQAAAMDEGMADYFTAAKTGDTHIGEYTPISPQREVNNSGSVYTFSNWDNIYPPHGRGLILAGALWDLRTSSSLEAAWGYPADFVEEVDRLALGALRWSPQPENFTEYYNQLISVNSYARGGSGEAVIKDVFCNRGWPAIGCSSGKGHPFVAREITAIELDLNAYPNPASANASIEFTLPHEEDVLLDVYNVRGQRVRQLVLGRLDGGTNYVELPGAELSSGVYFIRLTAGSTSRSVSLIIQN